MRKCLFLLILVLASRVFGWWDNSWTYRRQIWIDNTGGPALTNYQIKIVLDSSNFPYTLANSDGSDLRVIDSDDSTKLHYWIEEYRRPLFPNSDFRVGDATNWKFSGNAQLLKGGPEDTYWVNFGGWATGKLRSADFILRYPIIEFYYRGSGTGPGCGISLKKASDGSVLISENRTMGWKKIKWDVSAFVGTIVYIEVVDNKAGGIFGNNSACFLSIGGFYGYDGNPWNFNDTTIVWAKIPYIPSDATKKIYLYYGNPLATSESNLDSVYNWMHFEKSLITELGKWERTEAADILAHTTTHYHIGCYGIYQYNDDTFHQTWVEERLAINNLKVKRLRIFNISSWQSSNTGSWWHWVNTQINIRDTSKGMTIVPMHVRVAAECHIFVENPTSSDTSVIGSDGRVWYAYEYIIPETWDRGNISIEFAADGNGGDQGAHSRAHAYWDVVQYFKASCRGELPVSIVEELPVSIVETCLPIRKTCAWLSILPNPSIGGAKIKYGLHSVNSDRVLIEIVDVTGRVVNRLVDKEKPSGNYIIYWNGSDTEGNRVSSGVYFIFFSTGKDILSEKLIFLK